MCHSLPALFIVLEVPFFSFAFFLGADIVDIIPAAPEASSKFPMSIKG